MLVDIIADDGLVSTASNGYAISAPKYMHLGTLSEIKQTWEYQAIGDDSIADTLRTLEPIIDGDNLVIYYNDIITEVVATGIIDDTLGSGYYTMDTSAITTGGIPQGYLTNKALEVDFGAGYVLFTPDSETFSFGTTLGSIVTYPDYINESITATTKITFSASGNKMVDMSSKTCYDLFADCFLTKDNFKIQTKDNQYFCAITTGQPVIDLLGEISINHNQNTPYIDAGASALDSEDGDITGDIVVVNSVDIATLGSYNITYNVQDSEGNSAAEVIRTVNIVDEFENQLLQELTIEDFDDFSNWTVSATSSPATIIVDPDDAQNNIIDYNGTPSHTSIGTYTVPSAINCNEHFRVDVRSNAVSAGGGAWDYCSTGTLADRGALMSGSMNSHPGDWYNEFYYRGFSYLNPWGWHTYSIESIPNLDGVTATKKLYIDGNLEYTEADVAVTADPVILYYHGRSVNNLIYTDYIKLYRVL